MLDSVVIEMEESKDVDLNSDISGGKDGDASSPLRKHQDEVLKLHSRIQTLEREIKMRSLMQSMLIHDQRSPANAIKYGAEQAIKNLKACMQDSRKMIDTSKSSPFSDDISLNEPKEVLRAMRHFSSFRTIREKSESDYESDSQQEISPQSQIQTNGNTIRKIMAERSSYDVYTIKEDSLDIQDSNERLAESKPSVRIPASHTSLQSSDFFSIKKDHVRASPSFFKQAILPLEEMKNDENFMTT